LAHVANAEAEQAQNDAAKAKRKEALERFGHAAELQPGTADNQFWLASASFERIDDVGVLSKMSLASDGRKGFEKAIALDPGHVGARIGLAQYLLGAPGIAGGSVEKAKAQGDALLALPGKRGEFQGRMVLAGIAAHEANWAEMTRQYTAAETAQGEGADPLVALRSQASNLLNRKKDPQAALPVVARYVKAAPADDLTAAFFDGEVKRQLGHCADALPRYDQVIAKFAGARGSRWGAAVCREQLGQKDAARRDYEEYARRFPDDDRAKEAKAAIKRLQ
jgi:tetratricopeptide (TPR) repeat protein